MVGSILRLMLTRGLSIVRWNNFPRVVDIKQLDNVGATLHTALFLAYHEKQETGKEIDELYLIKKIIFSSLADLVLSDINSGTKSYIKKKSKSTFEALYSQAYKYFTSQDSPEYLHDDFLETLTRKDRVIEDQVFLAAKKYVGYFEAQTNEKVFPFMYEVPLYELKKSFSDLSGELVSFRNLLHDQNSQKYLTHIYRLTFAMRWNMRQRFYPISVMSHKVIVAYITYTIATVGNYENNEQNDTLSMLLRAIYHDVPEVITGDIVTPTKKAVAGFAELLEEVESEMMDDYMFSYISPEYKTYLTPYILHPFDASEGKKVKYADILSALFETKIEAQKGNQVFQEIQSKIEAEVSAFDNVGVEFLLQELSLGFMDEREDVIPPVSDL